MGKDIKIDDVPEVDSSEVSIEELSPWEVLVNRMDEAVKYGKSCKNNQKEHSESVQFEQFQAIAEHITFIDSALGDFKNHFSKLGSELLLGELPVAFHGLEVANRITEEAARSAMSKLNHQQKLLEEILNELSELSEQNDTETGEVVSCLSEYISKVQRVSKEVFVLQGFQDIVNQVIERTVLKIYDIELIISELTRGFGISVEDRSSEIADKANRIDEINSSLDSKESQMEVDALLKELCEL